MSEPPIHQLPQLLREVERRVNAYLFHGDTPSFASIPARPERDLDLLLVRAADAIEELDRAAVLRDGELTLALEQYRAANEDRKRLRALLTPTKCPNRNCDNGAIVTLSATGEPDMEQCQWCYEREQALQFNQGNHT